jgi:hypothetical protein
MKKHTPTPWNGSNDIWSINSTQRVAQAFGLDVIERKANADFIVRAVNSHEELLAACKASLQYYAPLTVMDDSNDTVHSLTIAQLENAIANATK